MQFSSNRKRIDPLKLKELLWPDVTFYDKQKQIIYSVLENDETVVPAGNMLGKDFVSGFITLYFFLSCHPCRIITTSVKDDHLRVLWGEIGRYIQTSKYDLSHKGGGPLVVNHHELKKVVNGQIDALSYVKGMVAAEGAAMQGHHIAKTGDGIPRTLFVVDEASGVNNEYYVMARTWADRILVIGNPWPCSNFFKHAVTGRPGSNDRGGDIKKPKGVSFYRKVIQIKAEDSPNVRYAIAQKKLGQEPTNTVIVPGVKPYDEYVKNRLLWDRVHQCVGLDAEFYEGAEVMMYPKEWMQLAMERANGLTGTWWHNRRTTMGVDSAQGRDNTSWVVCCVMGLIRIKSIKTPDTSIIVPTTIALAREFNVQPEDILFDLGGGGKQHVDALRKLGYKVRGVAFGESVSPEKRHRGVVNTLGQRKEEAEVRYTYRNKRAELYGTARQRLDPASGYTFAMPRSIAERGRDDGGPSLVQQLMPIPLWYDGEGRIYLPPKHKKAEQKNKESDHNATMTDLIGCSPDEADAFVLANYGLEKRIGKTILKPIC